MQNLLSVSDMLAVFRIGRTKFYDLGIPPDLYIGNSPRWTNQTIMDWIEAQKNKITKPATTEFTV